MRRTASLSVLFALLLAVAPAAFAAPPTDAQVDRLMGVMRVRQTVDAMWPQVQAAQAQAVQQATAGTELSAQERAEIDAMLHATNARLREALSWERLQPIYREIYAKTFDAADVEAMIEFYSSPAGQSLLEKMPQLMQNTMAATQKLLMPVLAQLQQDLQAAAEQAQTTPPAATEADAAAE